ncbi:MAG: phage tail tape measure protein [Azoarcus sp.]|jgi:TP901 family phage tail tape measure protein|nr:phage tail tape measure protein [Azoarcus sp.]
MSQTLSLSIKIGAAAGAALGVFGNLQKTMQRAAKVTRDLQARQRDLGKTLQKVMADKGPISHVAHLTREYERQGQVIERLKARTAALGRAQAAQAANAAKRADLRGKMMETAAIAYLATRPIQVGIEFEASMSKVQALTRLDKNSPQMKALQAQARELGATTSFTASEAGQAQGFLAMAGLTPEQILKSMPSTLDLAKASGLDLQRTADIASNIQTAYGLDAGQMGRISDTLTKAFTTSNVDLEMLSQTMKYMGPVAAAAGMSLEESAAMAGLLGNAGIQADMAGTALRSTLSRLSSPPKAAAKALSKLGVATKDAQGNLRSVPEILADVSRSMQGMGSAEKIGLATDIFGARAAPGMMSLLNDVKKIEPYIDVVKNSAGAARKTAEIMSDNIEGDIKTLISAYEELSISLTETNDGPLREVVQSVTGLLRGLGAWINENKDLVGQVLKIAVGLLSFKVGLLAVKYGASLLISPFLTLFTIITKLRTVFLMVQAVGLKSAIVGMMNPVGLLVAAIGLLVAAGYLLYDNWEDIKGGAAILWEDIKNLCGRAWEGIKWFFTDGILALGKTIINWSPLGIFYKAFAGVLSWFGVELPATFTGFGARIIEGIGAGIDKAKQWLMDKIKGLAEMMPDWVRDKLGISSPSTVFMKIGGFTMAGLEEGLSTAAAGPLALMRNFAGTMAAAGALTLASTGPAMASGAMAQGGAGAMASAGSSIGAITINVHAAPGMNEEALAALVAQKIKEIRLAEEARGRSRLTDAE